jgi:hypothetical protein
MVEIVGLKNPLGISTFCDDIRFELHNKFSLIGCYVGEMVLFQPPPLVLPKLGIVVSARLPFERTPDIKLRVFMPGDADDKPSIEHEIAKEEQQEFDKTQILEEIKTKDITDAEPHRLLVFPLTLTSPVIPQTGHIKVRLVYGSQIVRVGSLRVSYKQPDKTPEPSS